MGALGAVGSVACERTVLVLPVLLPGQSWARVAGVGKRGREERAGWCAHLCARQDFTEDVNCAFEFLLKLTPLLDTADQRCK